ncbi:MAG: glycosyltransferase [Saprospiraceae bacterium]|nr:glycosyltransferase [Saprospiraceae bacterium]
MGVRLLARAESQAMDLFDSFTIISDRDRRFIQHKERQKIEIVPNGIDPEYFTPGEKTPEFDLVFVGNLGYYPNVHAARYLVKKILPLVQKKKEVKVLLAGARPHQLILDLQSDNVIVWSWLDDIRAAYHDGKIFVAPVFQGSGLQNKILEALACGTPCITTSQVNASIGAGPDDQLLIADDDKQFAAKIVQLLDDSAKQHLLAESGRRFVSLHFRWNDVSVPLINILKGNIINADH